MHDEGVSSRGRLTHGSHSSGCTVVGRKISSLVSNRSVRRAETTFGQASAPDGKGVALDDRTAAPGHRQPVDVARRPPLAVGLTVELDRVRRSEVAVTVDVVRPERHDRAAKLELEVGEARRPEALRRELGVADADEPVAIDLELVGVHGRRRVGTRERLRQGVGRTRPAPGRGHGSVGEETRRCRRVLPGRRAALEPGRPPSLPQRAPAPPGRGHRRAAAPGLRRPVEPARHPRRSAPPPRPRSRAGGRGRGSPGDRAPGSSGTGSARRARSRRRAPCRAP